MEHQERIDHDKNMIVLTEGEGGRREGEGVIGRMNIRERGG